MDLGFDIDQIGESQIIIRSIPQIFDVPESDTFFFVSINRKVPKIGKARKDAGENI